MASTSPRFTRTAAPHTGRMLADYFREHETVKRVLAQAIGRETEALNGYMNRGSIQTSILWELSNALKHNFFRDLAAQLPDDYATKAPADTTAADRIAALEKQVTILTAERDVLLRALAGNVK